MKINCHINKEQGPHNMLSTPVAGEGLRDVRAREGRVPGPEGQQRGAIRVTANHRNNPAGVLV